MQSYLVGLGTRLANQSLNIQRRRTMTRLSTAEQ